MQRCSCFNNKNGTYLKAVNLLLGTALMGLPRQCSHLFSEAVVVWFRCPTSASLCAVFDDGTAVGSIALEDTTSSTAASAFLSTWAGLPASAIICPLLMLGKGGSWSPKAEWPLVLLEVTSELASCMLIVGREQTITKTVWMNEGRDW